MKSWFDVLPRSTYGWVQLFLSGSSVQPEPRSVCYRIVSDLCCCCLPLMVLCTGVVCELQDRIKSGLGFVHSHFIHFPLEDKHSADNLLLHLWLPDALRELQTQQLPKKQPAHYRSILLLEVHVHSERMVTTLGLAVKHHEFLLSEARAGLTTSGCEACCSLHEFLGRGAEEAVLWGLKSSPLCWEAEWPCWGCRSCPLNCQALWVSWLVASSGLERAVGSAASCQVSPDRFLLGRDWFPTQMGLSQASTVQEGCKTLEMCGEECQGIKFQNEMGDLVGQ